MGAETAWLPVTGGDHAMLRQAAKWHSLAARCVAGLLGTGPLPREVEDAFSSSESSEPSPPAPSAPSSTDGPQ